MSKTDKYIKSFLDFQRWFMEYRNRKKIPIPKTLFSDLHKRMN